MWSRGLRRCWLARTRTYPLNFLLVDLRGEVALQHELETARIGPEYLGGADSAGGETGHR